jgi:hypothetical protein
MEAILRLNLGPALDLNRDRLYQLLRENLKYILPTTDSSMSSRACADSAGKNKRSVEGTEQNPAKRRASGSGLRRNGPNDDKNEDDNEEEDKDEQLAHSPGPSTSPKAPLLACPFYKSDPVKYQRWRGCPGPGWDGINRLKYVFALS